MCMWPLTRSPAGSEAAEGSFNVQPTLLGLSLSVCVRRYLYSMCLSADSYKSQSPWKQMKSSGFTLNLSSQVRGSKHHESRLLQDPNMDKKHWRAHLKSDLKRTRSAFCEVLKTSSTSPTRRKQSLIYSLVGATSCCSLICSLYTELSPEQFRTLTHQTATAMVWSLLQGYLGFISAGLSSRVSPH